MNSLCQELVKIATCFDYWLLITFFTVAWFQTGGCVRCNLCCGIDVTRRCNGGYVTDSLYIHFGILLFAVQSLQMQYNLVIVV